MSHHKLTRQQKIELGEMIARGHRQFGKVASRRPYADDEGGTGTAQLFPEHPLLSQQPLGASSDLTFLVNENNQTKEKIEERSEDLNPQLRKALENKLGHELAAKPQRAPEATRY